MPASPHPPSSPTTINSAQPRPLIVRLRNWVGDVTLALPLLERLATAGFAPVLVGKGWARELLAGTGWPVHGLPRTASERVALLRRLREEALCAQPAFRQAPVQALCLPDSFSSALELRLAGLRAVGHAWEGRRLLLAHAVPRPRAVHELEVYWRLGQALLGTAEPPPPAVRLRPTETQLREAAALRAAHGLPERVIVICPFSGGTWNGQSKDWPAFADFVAQRLPSLGLPFVVCPGRGDEERLARERFVGATLLPDVDLGVYAALLASSAAMLSNDTGPAHIAAAVGTPLVSVMGPSDPTLWHPWGPASRVCVLGGRGNWPDEASVMAAVQRAVQAPR
ncbi:MAG: glycosyltransferase family 9 protein [Ideonella sp. WA131b]|jgi:ADP-heptose:LPS heptosyltransferase|nr:glycosyltransferase family 9 protein [Ideonella sp. WA131b]